MCSVVYLIRSKCSDLLLHWGSRRTVLSCLGQVKAVLCSPSKMNHNVSFKCSSAANPRHSNTDQGNTLLNYTRLISEKKIKAVTIEFKLTLAQF